MNNRKEVAKRLRFYADGFDFGDSNPYWYVQKAMFDDIQIHNTHKLFARLADLIDPTCTDFGGKEGTNGEYYDFACNSCGRCFDVVAPNYCPHCGARVVQD